MKHRHFPRYNDDADFTTNAPSYYEDLARKEKLIRLLAERIWGYEKILDDTLEEIQERFHAWDKNLEDLPEDVKILLQTWLDNGTLDHIINDTIFNWKLDTSIFEQFRDATTTQLQQIAVNAFYEFGLSPDQLDSTDTLKNVCESDYERILIPDGVYNITDGFIVNTGKKKVLVGSENTIFSIDFGVNRKTFINLFKNIGFENIIFDFNNKHVEYGIIFNINLGDIYIKNCIARNVYDLDGSYGTNIFNIAAKGNVVNIDGITFENMSKAGNGITEDSGGNLTGLYYSDNAANRASLKGSIKNISAINLKNINLLGEMINEDVSAVFVNNTDTFKDGLLEIDHVIGLNFGKRLIKTDSSNVTIDNVVGHSDFDNVTAMIGLNNSSGLKSGITIGRVQGSGKMGYVVANNALNTVIDYIKADLIDGTPLLISRDGNTLNVLECKADRAVYVNTVQKIKNTKIGKVLLNDNGSTTEAISIANTNGVDNFEIGELIVNVDNKMTSVFHGEAPLTNKNIKIGKIVMNLLNTTAPPLLFRNTDGIVIDELVADNAGDTQIERIIRFRNCKNVKMGRIVNRVNTVATVDVREKSDYVVIESLRSTRATWELSINDSERVFTKDVDVSRITGSDDTGRRNSMPILPYTTGTHGNRPNKPRLGHMFYDRTYNRVLVCISEAVVDSSGNVTTASVWFNLNNNENA